MFCKRQIELLKWPFPLLGEGLHCFWRSLPAALFTTRFSLLGVVSVSSSAAEEMELIFAFSTFSSKVPFSKNEKHFKCQQDLPKLLQSKQSSTLCQEENSGMKHLNEGLEPPGESVASLERGSRGAEHSVSGSEHHLCEALH